jgi:type II secretory pathway pseudopilin PulG
MKNLILILLGALAAPAFSGELTQNERDRAMSELHATRKQFLDAVSGLSEAQWSFKADPDRWSIAECAEHIALAEDALFGMVKEKLMASPPDPAKVAETKGKDQRVLQAIADRSHKAKAPEYLQPKHTWSTPAALIDHFKESRDRTIKYVESSPDDLRAHAADSPGLGPLDAYQWILFISAHSARHTAQIQEVKASPGFPQS